MRILNRQESSIPALEVNNTIIDTGLDKACALNNFFYSCFNHNYPTIQETTLDSQLLSSIDCPSELLCTEEGVYEELTRLDVTKSVGSDGKMKNRVTKYSYHYCCFISRYLPLHSFVPWLGGAYMGTRLTAT